MNKRNHFFKLSRLPYLIALLAFLVFQSAFAEKLPQFQVEDATIDSVENALLGKQITCENLVYIYIESIKKYDLALNRGAPINAFVSINPSVLDDARQLDEFYKENQKLVGPLHCIPVVLKDNIDSFDSPSTSGSLSMLGSQPMQDAFIVAKMRKAGAIILGKGAMDEFAMGMTGISSKSGRTGNAYDPNQNPGGSSSGPAAAVSANFALVGVGTDNSGSIIIPAAFNGLYGLRPSIGLISQTGIFPGGNIDGVAGPMARSIKDLAVVLTVIAQPDATDPKTQKIPRVKSYVNDLDKYRLQGKRIGIVRSISDINLFEGKDKLSSSLYEETFSFFKKHGATLVDNIEFPKFNSNRDDNMVGSIESINAYLKSFPSTRISMTDICKSNRTDMGNSKCLAFIKKVPRTVSKKHIIVLEKISKNRNYVEGIMQKYHLDALLLPISNYGYANYDISHVYTWKTPLSSNSGLPSLVFNIGYTKENLPVAMELVGKMYDESQLLALGSMYQRNTQPLQFPELETSNTNTLMKMTIPELNNLFTKIGYITYQKILINNDPSQLTASKFQKIVASVLNGTEMIQ